MIGYEFLFFVVVDGRGGARCVEDEMVRYRPHDGTIWSSHITVILQHADTGYCLAWTMAFLKVPPPSFMAWAVRFAVPPRLPFSTEGRRV